MAIDNITKQKILLAIKDGRYKTSDKLNTDCCVVSDWEDGHPVFSPEWPVLLIKFDDVDEEFGFNVINGFTDDPDRNTNNEIQVKQKYFPSDKFSTIIYNVFEDEYYKKLKDLEDSLDKPEEPERDHSEDKEDELKFQLYESIELKEVVDFYLKHK